MNSENRARRSLLLGVSVVALLVVGVVPPNAAASLADIVNCADNYCVGFCTAWGPWSCQNCYARALPICLPAS